MRRSKDWLDQAIGDLEHARASIELGHFEWSCFAAQQAAEKAAKAVFEDMGNAHPSGSPRQRFTHDEAARLVKHAQRIVDFCAGLLSPTE